MLIDSHCHLQHYRGAELGAVLQRARERGVEGFLVPSVRLQEAEEILMLCDREPGVWCALGAHPHDAATWTDESAAQLRALLDHPKVVAVGECGLDFFYDHAPRDLQQSVFRAQIEIALEAGLPIVVHNRESNETMLEVLLDPGYDGLHADLHSFAGGVEMARALAERDFYFGVSGMVTFPKAGNVREGLLEMDRDRQLVETDTPYLAPVPHRGQRNEPAYVVEVASHLAELQATTLEEVAARTERNFHRLFAKASG